MNQKHLLRFIKKALKTETDTIVCLDKDKKPMTLRQVFQSMNLTAYELTVDMLDVHAVSSVAHKYIWLIRACNLPSYIFQTKIQHIINRLVCKLLLMEQSSNVLENIRKTFLNIIFTLYTFQSPQTPRARNKLMALT